MIQKKFQGWLAIGISEITLSLILIAIAPTFLNSKKPWLGFAIWFTVPTVLASSSIYAVNKVLAANKARKVFLSSFPEYSALGVSEFLELSPEYVASQLDLLLTIKETAEIQEYNISLFEILEQTKK